MNDLASRVTAPLKKKPQICVVHAYLLLSTSCRHKALSTVPQTSLSGVPRLWYPILRGVNALGTLFVEHVPSVYCMLGKAGWDGTNFYSKGNGASVFNNLDSVGTNLKKRANSNINDIFFFLRQAKVSIWLATDKDWELQVNLFSGFSMLCTMYNCRYSRKETMASK